ncbi:MAG: hypothetical protein ACD_45C00625G0004 [uncultured bacterium]|nr:MAG: hypothetical protein ACD_45C00625G0004 [uncultured bacterium]OGT55824.1 MAG: hypothetical protein A3F43_03995 [Gammaproteobacteria bacterium RIFCSPHIGHO2_12_FULL_42_10]
MKTLTSRLPALFVFTVLVWSFAWPINKIGLDYISPLWYTAIRMIVGTIIMMLLVLACKQLKLPKRRDLPLILIVGWLQIGLFILLINLGLAYMPAGRSALLSYTTSLWIIPLSILILREWPKPLHWVGFICSLMGLTMLLSPWELNWSNWHIIVGCGMLIAASLSWAISMLCVRYMQWHQSPFALLPWQLLAGAIPIALLALSQEPSLVIHWTGTLVFSLAYTSILVTGFSYWAALVLNKELSPLVMSLGFLIVPIFSIALSAVFMHESITLITGSAMGLIVLGLIFVSL